MHPYPDMLLLSFLGISVWWQSSGWSEDRTGVGGLEDWRVFFFSSLLFSAISPTGADIRIRIGKLSLQLKKKKKRI